ncbi:unnamed protein product [Pipistrellus nathusii]|uniref:Uncharacterized protein n=1 Tax=Pipistrellus nathusii TaxID=59473 RepID=A0ABN9Z717_PIPNA
MLDQPHWPVFQSLLSFGSSLTQLTATLQPHWAHSLLVLSRPGNEDVQPQQRRMPEADIPSERGSVPTTMLAMVLLLQALPFWPGEHRVRCLQFRNPRGKGGLVCFSFQGC